MCLTFWGPIGSEDDEVVFIHYPFEFINHFWTRLIFLDTFLQILLNLRILHAVDIIEYGPSGNIGEDTSSYSTGVLGAQDLQLP